MVLKPRVPPVVIDDPTAAPVPPPKGDVSVDTRPSPPPPDAPPVPPAPSDAPTPPPAAGEDDVIADPERGRKEDRPDNARDEGRRNRQYGEPNKNPVDGSYKERPLKEAREGAQEVNYDYDEVEVTDVNDGYIPPGSDDTE